MGPGLAGAVLFAALLLCPALTRAQEGGNGRPEARRVVILTLDGISVDGFRTAETPNLDRLFSSGTVSLRTRDVMPSVTLPNYTSHLTGSGPEQHGVMDNDWEKDHCSLPPMVTDEDGYYPSVFSVLKENVPGIRTGFFYNWKNLIYPYNRKYIDEDSLISDTLFVPNYENAVRFMKENRESPTFLFIYSTHTDDFGHTYGWMSPEYIKAIEDADAAIGDFLDEMEKEGLLEGTHFLFVTDHGGEGHGHGGVTERHMNVPWMIAGPGIRRCPDMEEPNNTVNTSSVVLYLFGVEDRQPECWIGHVPMSIFN